MWSPENKSGRPDAPRKKAGGWLGLFGPTPDNSQKSRVKALIDRLPWKQRFAVYALWDVSLAVAALIVAALLYFTLVLSHPMKVAVAGGAPVIRIVDKHGELLAERGKRHPYMPLKLLPKQLIDAVIATEDRRFFDHWGLDPAGIARAALANLRSAGFHQGGSTLTQQLAKNLYLSSDRTLGRKIEEVLLALWLELSLTKSQILELYLNRVYFGAGAYGVESAAQRYFDKTARELSLHESALLAGLLKAPSSYSPITNPGRARTRARVVLAKMRDAAMITEEREEAESRQSLNFVREPVLRKSRGYEYLVDYALERLPQLSGLKQSEIVVETTIDARVQRGAHLAVTQLVAGQDSSSDRQAAVLVLDLDGGIVAMVGGRNYTDSQFNRATQARRQPGSAFKPIVYLAALDAGFSPTSTIQDRPIRMGSWQPRNYNGDYRGTVTLAEALAQSSNTAAVRAFQFSGQERVRRMAKRLGIESPLHRDTSLALGTAEIPLVELVSAYAHFANGGASVRPHIIRRVRLNATSVLYARNPPRQGRVLSAGLVAGINTMLHRVVKAGTGRKADFAGHQIAGKTGTTQGFRDAWFIGYSAHLIGGVWVGHDDGRPMKRVSGGGLPAEMWKHVMREAHSGLPPRPLPGLVEDGNPQAAPALARSPRRQTQAYAMPSLPPAPSRKPRLAISVESVLDNNPMENSFVPERTDLNAAARFAPGQRMGLGAR